MNPNPVNCGMTGPLEYSTPPSYRGRKLFCLQRHLHRHRRPTEPEASSSVSSLVSIPPAESHWAARNILHARVNKARREDKKGEQRPHIGTSTGNLGHVCAPDLNQGNYSKGDQAIEVD